MKDQSWRFVVYCTFHCFLLSFDWTPQFSPARFHRHPSVRQQGREGCYTRVHFLVCSVMPRGHKEITGCGFSHTSLSRLQAVSGVLLALPDLFPFMLVFSAFIGPTELIGGIMVGTKANSATAVLSAGKGLRRATTRVNPFQRRDHLALSSLRFALGQALSAAKDLSPDRDPSLRSG